MVRLIRSVFGPSAGCPDGDHDWELETLDGLSKTIEIDGRHLPYYRQLEAFADTASQHLKKNLERPFNGLTIGTNESGDLLYLDPRDEYSVWIFHHDGGDVDGIPGHE